MSRAEVHAAVAEMLAPLGAQPWSDPHNEDLSFSRVRVRAALADLVEALGPAVVLGLTRTADLLRADADLLDDLSEVLFTDLVSVAAEGTSADCEDLALAPRALRTRVLRLMGTRTGCPPEEFGYDLVGQVESLVVDWHGQGSLRLPGRVEAERRYGRLWFRSPAQSPDSPS